MLINLWLVFPRSVRTFEHNLLPPRWYKYKHTHTVSDLVRGLKFFVLFLNSILVGSDWIKAEESKPLSTGDIVSTQLNPADSFLCFFSDGHVLCEGQSKDLLGFCFSSTELWSRSPRSYGLTFSFWTAAWSQLISTQRAHPNKTKYLWCSS